MRMPRLPPVEKSPQTRLRATLWPGVGYSQRDLVPVAVEFFGDELAEAGERALAHLRAHDADDDGVVGLDHHPGAELGRGCALRARGLRAERQLESDCEASTNRCGAVMKERRFIFGT